MSTRPRRRAVRSLLLAALWSLVALPSHARKAPDGGAAILPSFSVQHETMRAGESLRLQACVTNVNAHSKRDLAAGDAFYFDFGEGSLEACFGTSGFAPDGSVAGSDFDCEVDGNRLWLTRAAGAGPFPPGAVACAEVDYTAGTSTSTVGVGYRVANEGSMAPPLADAIALNVGELGSVGPPGPEGPEGPAGPQGPPGPSGIGGAWMFVSTEAVAALEVGPAVAIPGLGGDITLEEGSRIVVDLDALRHTDCRPSGLTTADSFFGGQLGLELDGSVVAYRDVPYDPGGGGLAARGELRHVGLTWLSPPLAAGTHSIRVLLEWRRAPRGHAGDATHCIGDAGDHPGRLARLVVMEIRQ